MSLTSLIQQLRAARQGRRGCYGRWLLRTQNGPPSVVPYPVSLPFAQPFYMQKLLRIFNQERLFKMCAQNQLFLLLFFSLQRKNISSESE